METELKFQIDVDDIVQLRDLPILKRLVIDPPHVEDMVTTYFDTPKLWLHRHRAELRVREIDGARHRTQTLKVIETPNAGLHQRQEWESPVATPSPSIKD